LPVLADFFYCGVSTFWIFILFQEVHANGFSGFMPRSMQSRIFILHLLAKQAAGGHAPSAGKASCWRIFILHEMEE
jgi:hypothetical protein